MISFQDWIVQRSLGLKMNTCHNASDGRFCSGSGGFPSSLSDLRQLNSLGGSTGARLVEGPNGQRYVMKRGSSEGHLREEMFADSIYQAAGVNVPEYKLYETESGPVKLAKFVEGRELGRVLSEGGQPAEDALKKAQEGFMVDALLSNRDSVGLSYDNMLIDSSGKLWRIDNGGSLRYRAQGMPKSDWGNNPVDVNTLRNPSYNREAARVFSGIDSDTLKKQAQDLLSKKDKILASAPEELRQTLSNRIDNLQDMVQ